MSNIANNASVVEIFTDGSCLGNPGPGGWAALMRYQGKEKLLSGNQTETTNNQMEMLAIIKALAALKKSCDVEIYSDSKYVIDGINSWIINWKRNNWRNSKKQAVKNIELWQQMDELVSQHKINWHWVKGHSGHRENELVDELARQEAEKLR